MTFRHKIGSLLTFLPACLLSVNGLRAQSCSTLTTVGRYLYTCDGYLSPSANAPLAPARILGTVTADDNGTFTGGGTISLGGPATLTQGLIGTERLNRDCTGTITYTQTINGQPAPPLDITFIVSEHGDRIDGLPTVPGAVLSCSLRRLSTSKDGANLVDRSTARTAQAKSELLTAKAETHQTKSPTR